MDGEEIKVFEQLKAEYDQKNVTKPTALASLRVYNKYNEKKVKTCMCSRIQRSIFAKDFLEWYEGANR